MVNLRKRDRLMSLLCVCTMVLYSVGCSTPSVLKSVTDPDYQPTYNDGLLIGSALWGGEAAYGLLGGYLVGDFLYNSLSGASSSSDGSMQFLEGYPRQIEAQYLARLDETRQVIPAPMGDGIPGDTTNWDNALYYAIRPEARNVRSENFDPSTYVVDLDIGTVEILDTAYEAEPFTGTVIVNHPNNGGYRLIAYVNRGIMVETGSLWDLNGTKQLRHKYDENGILRESSNFDENGALARAGIYDEHGTLNEYRNYDENGTLRLTSFYDENGRVKEDHIYHDNGIISQRRTYGEDGNIETNQFFDEKGKRDIHKEGNILVSDVKIKIVRLNLYPNPAQDRVMLIYDQHELANEKFPIYFTGTVLGFYDKEYKIKWRQEEIKNGMHDGKSIWWYKNGTKQFEAEYVKGEPQGITKWYREDGYVEYEGDWQDNKLMRATTWDTSGQSIHRQPVDKEGKLIVGVNGKPKIIKSIVSDGNGTLFYLHPNGKKRLQETYEDSKITDTKWWDDQGNAVESVDPSFIPPIPRIK